MSKLGCHGGRSIIDARGSVTSIKSMFCVDIWLLLLTDRSNQSNAGILLDVAHVYQWFITSACSELPQERAFSEAPITKSAWNSSRFRSVDQFHPIGVHAGTAILSFRKYQLAFVQSHSRFEIVRIELPTLNHASPLSHRVQAIFLCICDYGLTENSCGGWNFPSIQTIWWLNFTLVVLIFYLFC